MKMMKISRYLTIITLGLCGALTSLAHASDTDTAQSLLQDMKTTRVKPMGEECARDWVNQYDFIYKHTTLLFVGKVISVGDVYERRARVEYEILTPLKGFGSAKQRTIGIYDPLSYKDTNGSEKKRPAPDVGTVRMVMAYKHQDIYREFNFAYCVSEKITEQTKPADGAE
tara:strand:+ start:9644 stop:10153 length:510 start_codon:yes stop_codon:yes gene_type:complete